MAGNMSVTSPAAEAWQLEFARMLPELEQLASSQLPPWTLRVLRSSQLDAQRLDAELHTMLQEQFMNIFKFFRQGQVSSLAPELNTLLATLVYWLSIWQGRATPGSELMNLRYRNETAMEQAAAAAAGSANSSAPGPQAEQPVQSSSWLHGGRTGIEGPGLSQQQKLGYAFAFVAMPYLWVRLNRLAVQQEWGQRQGDRWGSVGWRVLRGVDAAHKLGMLLNLWVFLYEGKYRTLVERLLGARLVYKQANMSRLISFEYLNRQLVWQELSEFLLFLLPLINVGKVKRWVMQMLPRMVTTSDGSSSRSEGLLQQYPRADLIKQCSKDDRPGLRPVAQDQQQQQDAGDGMHPVGGAPSNSHNLQQQTQHGQKAEDQQGSSTHSNVDMLKPVGPCPICGVAEMLVPFVAYPCKHIFCYYCLRSHCEADQEFQCPLDGCRVDAMQRYVRRLP